MKKSSVFRKKKNPALMKLPDNAKLVSASVDEPPFWHGLAKFRTHASNFSAAWILTVTTVAGFTYIPTSNGFTAVPIISGIADAFLLMIMLIGYFMDEIPSQIPSQLRRVARNNNISKLDTYALSNPSNYTLKNEGVTIQSWTASSFAGTVHFLLPFRIFRKVKMHESIDYYPYEDKYVKRTHYLTFTRWIEYKDTFEGHRAVFQKAIDSF